MPQRRAHPLLTALCVAATAASACTTITQRDIAKRDDYLPAMTMEGSGKPADALALLPTKESGGFVTTLERGWLGVLAGNADPDAMAKVGAKLEERKTLHLSAEAKGYFYKQTDDGYLPAEHEAIAFHLVTGFAYAQRGKREAAAVEARKASFYLETEFAQRQGFDDPALRLWSAALWAYAGDWESARVDFRRIAELDPRARWAARLAKLTAPPESLVLVMGGPGPDVEWHPNLDVRSAAPSLDAVTFVPGTKSAPVAQSFSTSGWYLRHQERDRAIRQVMGESRYVAEGLAPAGLAGVVTTVGTGLGVLAMVGGIGSGLGIAYVGVRIGAAVGGDPGGDIAGLFILGGLVVGYEGYRFGMEAIRGSGKLATDILDAGFNPTNSYRYVRFLPDFVGLAEPGEAAARQRPFLDVAAPGGRPRVIAYYTPGSLDDIRRAARFSRWRDGQRHREWTLAGSLDGVGEAVRTCAALGGGYALPTWSEVLDARQDGFMRDDVAPALAARLAHSPGLWTRSSAEAEPGRCRFVDPKDFGEGTVTDCETPRSILCVRAYSD